MIAQGAADIVGAALGSVTELECSPNGAALIGAVVRAAPLGLWFSRLTLPRASSTSLTAPWANIGPARWA